MGRIQLAIVEATAPSDPGRPTIVRMSSCNALLLSYRGLLRVRIPVLEALIYKITCRADSETYHVHGQVRQ